MNRTILPVLALALLAAAAGCSSSSSSSSSSPNIGEASSSLSRDKSPSVASADMQTLVSDNSAFALQAYQVVGKGSGNAFFSPYSISSALAMTYAGAGGQTATEMAKAMHFSLDQSKLHPAFDSLDLALASRATAPVPQGEAPVVLHIANGLFGEQKDTFGKAFLDTLMVNYGAGVKLVDFAGNPDGSRLAINGWIDSQTNSKIPNMLGQGTIDSTTRFVLVDAVYFDGNWATQFDPKATASAPFTKADGSQVSVSMMNNGELNAPFSHSDAFDAIELGYAGGQIAMDLVIPKAGTFATFDATLAGDSFAQIVAGMKNGPVTLAMPKFKIAGGTVSLKDMLSGFGMTTAFTPGADFSAIDTTTHVFIGDVLHKAFVSVDESGTEAAAATAVIGVGTAAPLQPTAIRADRPFFFAIRDVPTGAIIFAGRVADPSAN